MDYEEIDVWSDWLGIQCGGYDSGTEIDLYNAAKMIGDKSTKSFVTDIAKALDISENYASMLQYILANARKNGKVVFDYGTSPRGLFVWDNELYKEFMADFEVSLSQWDL